MSSKKKPESQGIKSFFISKSAPAAPVIAQTATKHSAKETVCVDLIESDESIPVKSSSQPAKKNAFFMSKVRRKRYFALEYSYVALQQLLRTERKTGVNDTRKGISNSRGYCAFEKRN